MTLDEYINFKSSPECYSKHDALKKFLISSDKQLHFVGTVACAGFKYILFGVDGMIVYVVPKQIAARDRGCLYLYPDGVYKPAYYVGARKLANSIEILCAALGKSNSLFELHKMLGGETCSCAICGETLTDELSKARGIGPVCWKKVMANDATDYIFNKRLDAQ